MESQDSSPQGDELGPEVTGGADEGGDFEATREEFAVTQALQGAMMDVGGPQSVDIDAGTDNVLECVAVDIAANTVFVKINHTFISVT